MTENKKFMDAMQADIESADIPEIEKSKLLKNLLSLKEQKINLMITGATGCGKSSTINALFGEERAKVGVGVDPETMEIERYDLGNLILWDSPGLGDGKEADNRHAKNIINKLLEKDSDGNLLIDMVLVILDGSSRDLGTSYQLINEVIIPNLGENKANRILVAINKVDSALNGRHWNWETNRPDEKLQAFMDEKAESVRRRIKEGTGVNIEPICYKAGFKEEGEEQDPPYNLTKLFSYILKYTPKEKRIVYMDNVNNNPEMWKDNDDLRDYSQSVKSSFLETFTDCIGKGADIGGDIGSLLGPGGRVVGSIIGAGVGAVTGIVSSLTSGCYITTATCEEFGKPDDCYELTSFRKFRDEWLKQQPDGEELIAQYYATAPAIVELINKQPDRAEIYRYINDNYLKKCLEYIEQGENEKCKKLYTDMMEYLYEEQQKWQ